MQPFVLADDVVDSVNRVMSVMTPAAKAVQMLGLPVGNLNFSDIERSPDVEVPGIGDIRGYRYRGGVRGLNLEAGQPDRPSDGNDFSTVFPVPAVRAAAWDVDLEKRVGAAIGDETAASRNTLLIGPGLGLLRHPYWGHAQDAYGEDPYLTGRLGTAFTTGVQQYVTGSAAHFVAANV